MYLVCDVFVLYLIPNTYYLILAYCFEIIIVKPLGSRFNSRSIFIGMRVLSVVVKISIFFLAKSPIAFSLPRKIIPTFTLSPSFKNFSACLAFFLACLVVHPKAHKNTGAVADFAFLEAAELHFASNSCLIFNETIDEVTLRQVNLCEVSGRLVLLLNEKLPTLAEKILWAEGGIGEKSILQSNQLFKSHGIGPFKDFAVLLVSGEVTSHSQKS